MSTAEHKALARRYVAAFEEYWRTGDPDVLDAVLADTFISHGPSQPPDRENLKHFIPAFRSAFPDLQFTLADLLAEGDKVVVRLLLRGTHQGELMGVTATGKPIAVTEMHIVRVAGGKIVERWVQWDALGLLQQLVAIPAPEGAAA